MRQQRERLLQTAPAVVVPDTVAKDGKRPHFSRMAADSATVHTVTDRRIAAVLNDLHPVGMKEREQERVKRAQQAAGIPHVSDGDDPRCGPPAPLPLL